MKTKSFLLALVLGTVSACHAGWLNPTQPGFVIQTFTSYEPVSGNNSGTIVTNGNSYQFAGDNAGSVFIGGPGSQFRGGNQGGLTVDGDGAFVMGSFAALSAVTNHGKGSLLLGNLSTGQRAVITEVGNAALLLGAGTVSNSQSIVVGDGMESHGNKSVTAGSFWAMGSGFVGDGSGLTGLPTDLTRFSVADGVALGNRVSATETNLAGLNANTGNYLASERTIYVATNGNDAADGRTPEKAKRTINAGVAAAGTNWTVIVRDGTYVLTNCVTVSRYMTVRSEHGATNCVVDGNGTNRCFHLNDGTIDGFSITGGHVYNDEGAGVYIEDGTVRNCRIYRNTADGTGAQGDGAGVSVWLWYAMIENCLIYSNTAHNNGGGVQLRVGGDFQTVRNCLILGNTADWGGGIYATTYGISRNTCSIENSTIARNTATGTGGGGVYLYNGAGVGVPMSARIRNSILYFNSAVDGANYKAAGIIGLTLDFNCCTPALSGTGNIAGDPLFLGTNDFHLAETSPCINAGTNWTGVCAVDLDGNARINGGRIDIGAYEALGIRLCRPGRARFSTA